MRKTLFALLVIWTLPHIAWADNGCNEIDNKDNCNSRVGCFWKDDGTNCNDCDDYQSFYDNNDNSKGSLGESSYVDRLTWEWDTEKWNNDSAPEVEGDCAWAAACPKGHVLNYNNYTLSCVPCGDDEYVEYQTWYGTLGSGLEDESTYKQCGGCPANSEPNADKNKCECDKGYHVEDPENVYDRTTVETTSVACVEDKYKIVYFDWEDNEQCTVQNTGDLLNRDDNNDDSIDCGGKLVQICEDGQTLAGWEINQTSYALGATLTAQSTDYDVKPVCKYKYTVKYVCIIDGVDVCSGELTCTEGTSCTVKSPTFEDKPYYVTGWTCSGCGNGATALETTVDLKDHISSLQNNDHEVTLTAQIAWCPALYEGSDKRGTYNNGTCTMRKGEGYTDKLGNTFTVPDDCTYSPPSQ